MTETANPLAPKVGRLGRFLGPLHVTGVFWFRFHLFGARVLPEWLKPAFIFGFSAAFWLALRRIRVAIADNLEAVLGPCRRWERQQRIFRTFHTFAWCLTERYERLSTDHSFRFEVDNGGALNTLAQQQTGFIFVTAHAGNWEVGASMPSAVLGRRVHLVRERELDPRAQEFISSVLDRRMGAGFVTHFAGQTPELGLLMRDALSSGEIVALQGDRPRTGGQSVIVRLFNLDTPLPTGPAALARLTGAPLVPVFVIRLGRRAYRTMIGDPIIVRETANRAEDLTNATQSVATELESVIRRWPYQWFVFSEIWPRRTSAD